MSEKGHSVVKLHLKRGVHVLMFLCFNYFVLMYVWSSLWPESGSLEKGEGGFKRRQRDQEGKSWISVVK